MIQLSDSTALDDSAITERFIRSSGQRGQNVKHEATGVELRVDLTKVLWPPDVTQRVVLLAGRHVTHDGQLVVASRVHRSQLRNRDAARARLVALLKRAAAPPAPRTATRPGRAEREQRLVSKHRKAGVKRSRAKMDED